MTRLLLISFLILLAGCNEKAGNIRRIPIARAGESILYADQLNGLVQKGISPEDSTVIINNYINSWAKKELLLQKAEENLSPELRLEIDRQVAESRANFVIYEYQKQLMLERMDTLVSDAEIENYYLANQESFVLSSNIVKALFLKIPYETPDLEKIKNLARASDQVSVQQLESISYQFADKFDDFGENWIPISRISAELPQELENEENFLRRTTFYEVTDSVFIYLISIRDYRLRLSVAPFEYVKEDIRHIIWNNRRFEFLQSLESGIYNDAIRDNKFTLYNKPANN
jgi:hypothetical protein